MTTPKFRIGKKMFKILTCKINEYWSMKFTNLNLVLDWYSYYLLVGGNN
jgi:hypothetical protein